MEFTGFPQSKCTEYTHCLDKKHVRYFNCNTNMQSYDELVHLNDCLNFRLASMDYEIKWIAVNKYIKDLGKMFIED